MIDHTSGQPHVRATPTMPPCTQKRKGPNNLFAKMNRKRPEVEEADLERARSVRPRMKWTRHMVSLFMVGSLNENVS